MAGDWIKVEHATLDKPEVTLFAELLGVSVDEGFGKLVRFWMWLDKNSCNGSVTHVSRLSIDTTLHTPGFSGALEQVGWIKFDDSGRTATIPNFGRHHGSSAKTRGLTQKRVQKHRNDSVTLDALPEKRREEKRIEATSVVQQKTRNTVLQEPTAEHQRIADERGVSCLAEFQKYRDWLAASRKPHRDENAGFRYWLRNAKPGVAVSLAERRTRNMDILTGKARDERSIVAERVGGPVVLSIPGDLRESGGDDVGGFGPERGAAGVG